MPFTDIENAIAAIERGEFVVVVDDADRENEGDRCDELQLPLMVANNTEAQRTAFTVSVDARAGTSTGISAGDRAATVPTRVTTPEIATPGKAST